MGSNLNKLARNSEELNSSDRILLSYQLDYQSTVKKIGNFLISEGYDVWIDKESMGKEQNKVECRSEAIENADVIVVCFSHKYTYSDICKSEAMYAVHLKKKIIPIRLEINYKPIGWLNSLIIIKPYIDFSIEENRNMALEKLVYSIRSENKISIFKSSRNPFKNYYSNVKNSLRIQVEQIEKLKEEDLKINMEFNRGIFTQFLLLCNKVFIPQEKIFNDREIVDRIPELFLNIHRKYLLGNENIVFTVCYDVSLFLLNGTHYSNYFGRKIFEDGCIEFIVKNILGSDLLSLSALDTEVNSSSTLSSKQVIKLVRCYLGTLYNILRLNKDLRKSIRNFGTIDEINNKIEQLSKYKEIGSPLIIKATCLMLLTYLVDDVEREKLKASHEMLTFMAAALESALDHECHQSSYGFYAEETLHTIVQLAIDDEKKQLMIEYIPLLFRCIKEALTEREQRLSLKCIYTLSFHEECEELIQLKRNIRLLKTICEKGLSDNIKQLAKTVLYEINRRNNVQQINTIPNKPINGHIMLSYHLNNQEIVLKISNYLKSKGYSVWIDVDEIRDHPLDSISEAITNARVLLVCFSREYSQSNTCRSEADYAFRLHKDMIPLKLEKNYSGSGWLARVLDLKSTIDFSDDNDHKSSIESLLGQLGYEGLKTEIKD